MNLETRLCADLGPRTQGAAERHGITWRNDTGE